MGYFIKSLTIFASFIALTLMCWLFGEEIGVRVSTLIWIVGLFAALMVWGLVSAQRLKALGLQVRLALIPLISWVIAIVVPILFVLASPDSDDPGPVGAVFAIIGLSLASALISVAFICFLSFDWMRKRRSH